MKKGRPKGGRQQTGPVFDLVLALTSELALSCLLSVYIYFLQQCLLTAFLIILSNSSTGNVPFRKSSQLRYKWVFWVGTRSGPGSLGALGKNNWDDPFAMNLKNKNHVICKFNITECESTTLHYHQLISRAKTAIRESVASALMREFSLTTFH